MTMENVQRRKNLYGLEYREEDRRRAPEGGRKTYEIKSMWQRNHEIINLVAIGFKHVEVAEILGVDPATVSSTVNSELGQRKLSEIRQERDNEVKKQAEKIRILTNKALQHYNDMFDKETIPDKLKTDVADTVVLELSGLRVPTKIQSASVHTVLTKDEIEGFKERGLKAARESGVVIDAESEEINDSMDQAGSPRQLTAGD